jgi:hypothetical protein
VNFIIYLTNASAQQQAQHSPVSHAVGALLSHSRSFENIILIDVFHVIPQSCHEILRILPTVNEASITSFHTISNSLFTDHYTPVLPQPHKTIKASCLADIVDTTIKVRLFICVIQMRH